MTFTIMSGPSEDLKEPELQGRYESLEAAREALRQTLGWHQIWLAPGYTTKDGENQIWRAYESRAACDADSAGENTPRVTRLLSEASTTSIER